MEIIPLTPEHRVRRDVHRDVQITRFPAIRPRVAPGGDADAIAVPNARRHAYLDDLAARGVARSGADVARARPLLPRSPAGRAAAREHHVTANGPYRACPLARRTCPGARPRAAGPGARAAVLAAQHGHLPRDAMKGLLEPE
jgi:hypothetical protein